MVSAPCPRHNCSTCGTRTRVLPCIRCYKSFHPKCVPYLSTELTHGFLCPDHATPKTTTELQLWHKVTQVNLYTELLDVRFSMPYTFDSFELPTSYISSEKRSLFVAKGEIVADVSELEESRSESPAQNEKKSAVKLAKSSYASLTKKPKFINITKNIYVSGPKSKPMKNDDISICNCMVGFNCSEDYCMNRMLHIECDSRFCPTGDNCQNQRLQKQQYFPIQIIKTSDRGFGAVAKTDIPNSGLIVEYCGEIIDQDTRDERLFEMEKNNDTNYYFFSIDSNTVRFILKKTKYFNLQKKKDY